MIEDWIDAMQDVWAGIQDSGFKTVRAPYLVKRREYPETIDPAKLSLEPLALSIPAFSQFKYSAGGPNEGFYRGTTEFHVAPSLDMDLIPSLMKWPGLIAQAASASLKLGALVHNFVLEDRQDQITGPISLKYGNEAEHWGFIAYWEVKENLNASIAVATGE